MLRRARTEKHTALVFRQHHFVRHKSFFQWSYCSMRLAIPTHKDINSGKTMLWPSMDTYV